MIQKPGRSIVAASAVILLFLTSQLAAIPAAPAAPATLTGRVAWVYDGDSFRLSAGDGPVEVRIFGIDCPEKGQPFADRARDFVIRRAKGRQVTVLVQDRDRYGRLIGVVILDDGTDLSHALLANGLAWHYRRYSRDPVQAALQRRAAARKKGLWRQADPVPPWDYKRTR
jgi:endonuclease YncB( thermonuclease family)